MKKEQFRDGEMSWIDVKNPPPVGFLEKIALLSDIDNRDESGRCGCDDDTA